MKIDYVIVLLIVEVVKNITVLAQQQADGDCGLKCLVCEFNNLCSQCEVGFAYTDDTKKCRAIQCEENEFLFELTQTCLEICPSQYLEDSVYRICIQLPDCPQLDERGQNYFDSFSNALMTSQWVVTYGIMQQQEDYSLKLFSRQDVQYQGEMLGHTSMILGMFSTVKLNSQTQEYDNQLITFSAVEVIIWNMDYGYIISKFTYDPSLKASSMYYLDSDILLINSNEFQFAVVYLNLNTQQSNLLLGIQTDSSSIEDNQSTLGNLEGLDASSDLYGYDVETGVSSNNIQSVVFNQFHTKVLNGYFRIDTWLYSYALDSIIAKYDFYKFGKSDGIQVCTLPSSLIIIDTQISENKQYVFLILQDQLSFGVLIVSSGQCLVVDQSSLHLTPITNLYLDNSQQALFTVSATRTIFSSYQIDNTNINNPVFLINTIQQINLIDSSKIWVQSGFFILVQQHGQILISLIQGQSQLLEKYSLDLNLDYDFELSQVIIDLMNQRALFFGTELISLTLNADLNQVSIEDRQKNILKTQAFHLDQVNGFIFDNVYSRVISYSQDGMIIIYASSSFFESNSNDNLNASDLRKKHSLSGYQVIMSALHPSCTMEQYRANICPRGVVNILQVRYNLLAALYDDNTIIMWNYSQFDISVAKNLSPTDTTAPFVNMYASGTNFAFCNTKQMLVYKVDTYTLVKNYTNSFYYCAIDQISSVDHILFIKISTKNVYVLQLSNSAQKYIYAYTGTVNFTPTYYPTTKMLVFATSSSYIYYLTFPIISTGAVKVSVNIPTALAYNPVTDSSLVFSANLASQFYTTKSTLQRSFKTVSAFIANQSILALSNPEIFVYYQNTGINAIQNQVFVLGSNFDYKMILTFQDKISSISADPITQKLYIGFQNGIVKVGNIDIKSLIKDDPVAFNTLEINNSMKLMFAYKTDIHVYDQILLGKMFILTSIHDPTIPLTGIIVSKISNTLVSYNTALSKNLVKWNLANGQGQSVQVIHTQPIIVTYLDDKDDILITISQDLTILKWQYSTTTVLQTFNQHALRKAQLDIDETLLDPSSKTVYTILFNQFDASCNKIITTNNIGELYLIDYVQNTSSVVIFQQVVSIYQDYLYQSVIVLIQEDYWYNIFAFQYTNTLDTVSINYFHDNKVKIRGVLFQGNYFYTYEDSIIVIMNRSDYSFVQQIECPNPIITNFIIFEKLNQVIIWSDVISGYTNTNIAIYDFKSGKKITDIMKQQFIEDGYIHKVVIDEEKYTLVVSKVGNNNFIFTIDLRTYFYTGYYTASFNTAINSFIVNPAQNLFYVIDATNFRIYNYETVTYNMNQFLQIDLYKNFNTYYNQLQNTIYYFDANYQGWQFSIDTKIVQSKESIDGIKLAKFWQGYLYVVAQNYLLKYSNKMVLVGIVQEISSEVYFSINYMFITTSDLKLIQIDLNGFMVTSFFKSLEDKVTNLIVVEKYLEVFISLANLIIYRFDLQTGNVIQFYGSIPNFSFFMIDIVNLAIIHVQTDGTIEIYYNYSQNIADYKNQLTKYIINNQTKAYQLLIDNVKQRLFALSIDSLLPHIKVYTYSFAANNQLAIPVLITVLQSPSFSSQTTMSLSQSNLEVRIPWEILQYDRQTLQYSASYRDANIFYDSQNYISFSQNSQLFLFISTSDGIFLYKQSNTTATFSSSSSSLILQFKFPLDYPILISYNVTSLQDTFFKVNLLGVSSGKFFISNFIVPSTQSNGKQATLDRCFLVTPTIEYNFEVENQLKSLYTSQTKLGLSFTQIALSVIGKKSFYYSPWMEYFSASVVYAKNDIDQDESISQTTDDPSLQIVDDTVIQLDSNSFSKNYLQKIDVDGYTLSMSQTQQILFNSQTQNLIFRSIELIGNTNNFSFVFQNFAQVTLKNLTMNNVELTNSTILFSFINCTRIWIEGFTMNGVGLIDNSQLFVFNNVKNITISGLNVTSLISSCARPEDFPPISFSNVKQVNISQSNFIKISHSTSFMHVIQAKGVLKMSMSYIQFLSTDSVGYINSINEFATNQQINILHNDTFSIRNSSFVDNNNLQDNLILLKSQKITVRSSNFKSIICPTCKGSVFNMYESNNILFQYTTFEQIEGQSGSAISFIDCGYSNAQILDSTFHKCSSTAVGGALFLDNSDLLINRTSIKNCSANIGGALRYINLEPLFVYYNNQYAQNKNSSFYLNNDITDNIGFIYGQNIGSYTKTIQIFPQQDSANTGLLSEISSNDSVQVQDSFNVQTFRLTNFQSGSEINFKLQILDQENNPINFSLNDYLNNKYPKEINDEILKFNIKVETQNESIKVFGQYATDFTQFNEEDSSFSIQQMMIMSNPEQSNYITFQTPSISKVIDPTQDNRAVSQGSFYVSLKIDFRTCIRGEVYKLSGIILYCQECKEGTYSLDQPKKDLVDQQVCKRCPVDALYCARDQMILKQGFWKYSNDSDSILSCKNKQDNCDGDEKEGYCIEGQIGPLCEQCDVYGKQWGESFQSDGKFGCVKCSKINHAIYVIPTILFGLGMVIYILISIRVALSISMKITSGYYMRLLKLIPISKSSYNDTTNVNMKAMMNFMQISTMINTFTVKLPDFMTFLPQYLGSPIQNLAYTFDCHLINSNLPKEVPMVYLRTLWTLLIPAFYLVGIGMAYTILVLVRVSKFNTSYIISGLVYLLFFTQPNMITSILGVMSCRSIDGKLYILSDISYECYTTDHLKYIALICFPGLLIYGFAIPLYILRMLYRYKNHLDYASVRLKYGILFQDYKNSCFYWEFIKTYKKMLIIVILQFYGDPFNNKLVIILVILLIYLVALLRVKPYLIIRFQEIEKRSITIIIILLIINIFLFNNPDLYQQYIFYVILIGLDNSYQLILILDVIISNTKVMFPRQYNFVVKKILYFFPFLSHFISVEKFISFKTFQNWKTVRKHLKDYFLKKKSSDDSLSLQNKESKKSHLSISENTQKQYSYRQPANTIHPALSSNINIYSMDNLFSEQFSTNKNQMCLSSFNNMLDCQSPNSLSLREQVEFLQQTSKERKSEEDNDNEMQTIKLAKSKSRKISDIDEYRSVIYKNLRPLPMDTATFQFWNQKILDIKNVQNQETQQNSQRHIEIKDDIDYEQLDEKLLLKKKITNHDFNFNAKKNLIYKNLILII